MKLYSLLLALAMSASLGACNHDSALQQTEQCGDLVVNAIESFRGETGFHPKSLDHLVPKYLRKVPQPAWGLKQWIYETWEDQFVLYVHESAKTGDGSAHWFAYESECPEQGWQLGDLPGLQAVTVAREGWSFSATVSVPGSPC